MKSTLEGNQQTENELGQGGGESEQLISGDASQPQTLHTLGRETVGGTQSQPLQLDRPANARRKRNGAEMSDEQREKKRMSDKKFKSKLKEKQDAIKFERDELLTENVRLKQEKDEIIMKCTDKLERENDQLKREIREKEQLFNSKLEALEAQIREKDDQRVKATEEKFEALLAKQKSDAQKKQLDFENKVLQRDLEKTQRLNFQLRQSIEQQDHGNSMLRQSYSSRGFWTKQGQIFLPPVMSKPGRISKSERILRQPIPVSERMSKPGRMCSSSSLRYSSLPHSGEESELKRLRSLYFEPLKCLESLSLQPLRSSGSGPLVNFTDSSIFVLVINNKKITKIDPETVKSLASFAMAISRLYSSWTSKLSSFNSSFHQRAEIMADGREKSSSKSSLKALPKMKKLVALKWPRLVARLRAKLNGTKECLEKQKAKAEEKAIKFPERRKSTEFLLKEDARIRHGVDPSLGILDAEDEGDFVGLIIIGTLGASWWQNTWKEHEIS